MYESNYSSVLPTCCPVVAAEGLFLWLLLLLINFKYLFNEVTSDFFYYFLFYFFKFWFV